MRRTLAIAIGTLVIVKTAKEIKFFVVDCAALPGMYMHEKRVERLVRQTRRAVRTMDNWDTQQLMDAITASRPPVPGKSDVTAMSTGESQQTGPASRTDG